MLARPATKVNCPGDLRRGRRVGFRSVAEWELPLRKWETGEYFQRRVTGGM